MTALHADRDGGGLASQWIGRGRGLLRRSALELQGHAQTSMPAVARRLDRADVQRMRRRARQDAESSAVAGCLNQFERSVFSQNGEDGILGEIFERVGSTNRQLVEIGAADGEQNCTRHLVEQGWTGVWCEADPTLAAAARSTMGEAVTVVTAGIHPRNVGPTLAAAGVPPRPDLVVVDIDGNDWWVLRSLLADYRPRVLVAEYNGTFLPGEWWRASYNASASWDRTFRHGASLTAMADLARSHGLVLVGCDSHGINAFFVAADEVDGRFAAPGSVDQHYRAPSFSPTVWGHPRSRRVAQPMAPLSAPELAELAVTDLVLEETAQSVAPGESMFFSVALRNGTELPVSSGQPAPIHLAIQWFDDDQLVRDHRALLPAPIPSQTVRRVFSWTRAPERPGRYRLRVTLVQEQVAWLVDMAPARGAVDAEIVVAA